MARRDVIEILRKEAIAAAGLFVPLAGRVRIFSAPSRLDVLGGLGVQVGGTVAQIALPLRTAAAVQGSDEPLLVIQSEQAGGNAGPVRIPVPIADGSADCPPWAAPILALWRILEHAHPGALPSGARILILSDIPVHAGQASTTALLAALAMAFLSLRDESAGISAGADAVALQVQQAEELCGAGGRGAAIDAMTCLLAGQPVAEFSPGLPPRGALLRYSAQPGELVGHIPLPENLRILALDTGVRHAGAAAAMEELRVAGAMGLKIIETIYRDLGQSHTPLHGYLSNTSPLLYRQYFRALLPRRLRGSDFVRTYGGLPQEAPLEPGAVYRVRTAVDHFIAENEHAEQFLQAMEELSERDAAGQVVMADVEERQRTLQRAGRLALASHHSYRLRLELSCREADWLVDRLMEAGPERGVYGARITGAGGGGTVMALMDRTRAAGDAMLEIMDAYGQITGRQLPVVEAGGAGSGGAMVVGEG